MSGLAEIVLWSRDLDRSLAFYRDLFGFQPMAQGESVKPRFLQVAAGEGAVPQMLVLVPHPDPAGSFPGEKVARPLHHMAFSVDAGAYERVAEACRAAGLQVRGGVHPVLTGVRTFYVDDPDGNEVEVIAPDQPPFGPLVSPAWLALNLGDPGLRVVDFRWELAGGSRPDLYLEGHVPGAAFVALESVTGAEGPGRHPLPSADQFGAAIRRAGVNSGSRVVVYDASGGFSAARLWWLLRYFGHAAAAVLDGGLPAWDGELETGAPAVPPGDFTSRTPSPGAVAGHKVVQALGGQGVVIDARVGERYRGEMEPIDARAGHIPGAVNIPWQENLDDAMRFRDPADLRARYEVAGVRPGVETVVYCGSGVSACVDLLAMAVAGLQPALLYEGSWGDWAARSELPLATGDG